MAARSIFSLASLILVAGALLLMFFILLGGAVSGGPVNLFYWLEVDTSNIPGAPALSRWTYWNVCGVAGNRNACSGTGYGDVSPARPFDPPRNFDTTVNIPPAFIGTHYYYLMTRFSFAFMLIALFFAACSLFTGLLALCTRLGAYMSGLLATIAWFFQALNAALMTVAYVKGRGHFNRNGQEAHLGRYAFGFEWASFACLFLAMIFFCLGGSSGKESFGSKRGGFFRGKRSKSTRSRGSFINGDKEYA